MKYLDLTLPTPEANLACDEALLDLCENGLDLEVLRLWEPIDHFVVVGYANRAADEVNLDACEALNIPVLRRCSGGGTVLQGRGCLNYTVVLKITGSAPCHSISSTNAHVMGIHRELIARLMGTQVSVQGTTDLAIDGVKFSGNAQRRRRSFLLFHGTFLLNFEIELMVNTLRPPSKAPEYRRNRSHCDFVRNISIPAPELKEALKEAWHATEPLDSVPWPAIDQLVKQRYATQEWTFKF